MSQPDVAETRERMRRLIEQAVQKPDIKALLKSDPHEALRLFDLTLHDIKVNFASDDKFLHATQPPGCADLTCIVSECPGTCWVTIWEP